MLRASLLISHGLKQESISQIFIVDPTTCRCITIDYRDTRLTIENMIELFKRFLVMYLEGENNGKII